MADALARRDFLYLLVLLAAFRKSHWFLALAAAGAPLYFFLLVVLARAGRQRETPAATAGVAVRVDNSRV